MSSCSASRASRSARCYRDLDEVWNAARPQLNERLHAARVPVQVAHLSSIWTVYYLRPSRYNWMFQYYLRAAGLALSWVGTGRLIFSLNYTDADFDAVAERIAVGGRGDACAMAGGGQARR